MTKIKKFSVIVFYNEKNELLLQEKGEDSKHGEKWAFFGGKIKKGESSGECFFRVAKEKLNLDMDNFNYEYIGKFEGFNSDLNMEIFRYTYLIKTDLNEKDFTVLKGVGCKYFSFENAKKLKFSSNLEKYIDYLEENII